MVCLAFGELEELCALNECNALMGIITLTYPPTYVIMVGRVGVVQHNTCCAFGVQPIALKSVVTSVACAMLNFLT